MEIHGHIDGRFNRLRDEFEKNFTERGDVGGSFSATIEGEIVIDIWGGHRDQAKTLPWEEDTIVNVFSTTKTMTALSALLLVDRGLLDVEAKVSKYWPEYGQNGKEETLVRHFLGHTAGLPGFGEKITLKQLYDWNEVIEVLQRQPPWYEPGSLCAYHAITQGFLVGELVRRISGKSLGTFFDENIARPMNADFHIGLDNAEFGRTAEILAGVGEMPELDPDQYPDYMKGHEDGTPEMSQDVWNSEGWRNMEGPAVNGHGNARSVVRAQTALANGGTAFGVDLLSQDTIDQIFIDQGEIEGIGARHGIGYGIDLGATLFWGVPEATKVSFWGGAGGSTIVVDHTNRICFSFVMNQMSNDMLGDKRSGALVSALYEAL
ncbi:beta-lactamase family protein [Gammaproteobacteria bacterium]|nr:beta-lactamase family protein [Gammaproteobacteria bacterium]